MLIRPSSEVPTFDAGRHAALRRDAWRESLSCFLLLAVAAGAFGVVAGFGPWFPLKAGAVFALAFAGVLRGLIAHAPNARFGPANRVTLLRLSLIALLAAVVGEPVAGRDAVAWSVVAVAVVAASLDAIDGPLARRTGLASAFGARFDMETDALLTLVLCMLLLHFEKAGAWILAAGLMRYAFVLAMSVRPWLARTLPPSLRRQAVCVVQIASLVVCIGPFVEVSWSRAIAAASLVALTMSFAVDIAWLRRHRSATPPESAP